MHHYISSYPGQDESYPLRQSFWNILEGSVLKDMPSTSQVELHKLLLSLYDVRFERKTLGSFQPVTRHTVTFLVTLGRMDLAHYKKAFGTFSKGMH